MVKRLAKTHKREYCATNSIFVELKQKNEPISPSFTSDDTLQNIVNTTKTDLLDYLNLTRFDRFTSTTYELKFTTTATEIDVKIFLFAINKYDFSFP